MTDTSTPTSTALAEVDRSPKALVAQYQQSFFDVLPSHVRPETWVRIAQGALKKGKRGQDGLTDVERAANNNVGVFLATLLDAARLGLEPGTEQYYLTPRRVKVNGGYQDEILGIIGYQGHIELMYRAGAVASVVAECVYEADEFRFSPGADETPHHVIDWDADDRGQLRLVYAFARMKDGATSKVVVLNRQAIERIKASSQGADSKYSPWVNHEPAMWLKSAVRQLAKWVPTSSEYRGVTPVDAPALAAAPTLDAPALPPDLPEVGEHLDDEADHYSGDDEVTDAEIVDDDQEDPEPPSPLPEADRMTDPQRKALHALLRKRGGVGDTRFPILSQLLGREVTSTDELSVSDASFCIDALQEDGAPEGGEAA